VLLDDDVTEVALTLTSHPFLWMGVVMVSKLALLQEVIDGKVIKATLTFIWGGFLWCMMLWVVLDELGTLAVSAWQRLPEARWRS
jgi:hypothetical protein